MTPGAAEAEDEAAVEAAALLAGDAVPVNGEEIATILPVGAAEATLAGVALPLNAPAGTWMSIDEGGLAGAVDEAWGA